MSEGKRFRCSCCGKEHDKVPALHFNEPLQYHVLTEEEKRDCQITPDTCVISNQHFFILGLLAIPVPELDDEFVWGVWVSLSHTNFQRYQELRNEEAPEHKPFFGWLCNQIPGYPDTSLLKTHVVMQKHMERPRIILEPTEHPLAIDQRNGVPLDRLMQHLHEHAAEWLIEPNA